MGASKMGDMSLPVLQFLLTTVLGLVMSVLGFYIKAKLFEGQATMKAEVKQLLGDFLLEAVRREAKSDLRAGAMELRLTAVETGHTGITTRIDQLVNAIWAEHRAGTGIFAKQNHPESSSGD